MCWIPELVEFPCRWKKEDQPDYEELGIEGLENETSPGVVALDIKSITRANPSDRPGETTVEINGVPWSLQVKYEDFIIICNKSGVSFTKYDDILKANIPKIRL